ncbi:BREX-2 system adenine-specific DNA-methyltransferase PglX [Agrococcus sediminis]|uniref:BREX-2 system adenine-specific DNA-methyltransferase PglX n=1 Tax=Agrococcus sediminis TaxID=2599924 RepID=UPI0038065283
MIDSPALLADLKRELAKLDADLRDRAEAPDSAWGSRLRDEYARAQRRGRTGLSWVDWRNGEVAQAGVSWIIATVFVRFAEDNGLLTGAKLDGRPVSLPWIAGPGDGTERATEHESDYYGVNPTLTGRDWLQHAFATLAQLPAGRPLVDPDHAAVWHAPISAGAADELLRFFRRTKADGTLIHDFADAGLGTRFLGDLYQDLSEHAKKTFALLQTPEFVEEFILDLTLTPAIAEFGINGLKLIDPACGSGHFLLGAFDRLVTEWAADAPGLDKGERVQRALDSIHGVDLNPFAVAIARFRLTVAALRASGLRTLVGAPAFRFHLAIGDALLGGAEVSEGLDLGDGERFQYAAEDLSDYKQILGTGQYHVVVANPPYITVKDPVLNQRYRDAYPTCSGTYALSVPFSELLFRLARRASHGVPAGYVGQITSNSFMKREFGRRIITHYFSGIYTGQSVVEFVDLTHVVDSSGAYIPGHGTPTVIMVGRPRRPAASKVRAVLGIRGEPGRPAEAELGLVWTELKNHLNSPGFEGRFVSVTDLDRSHLAAFPWSLAGGGASSVMKRLETGATERLGEREIVIGRTTHTGLDEAFYRPLGYGHRMGIAERVPVVLGDTVRDFSLQLETETLFPYDNLGQPIAVGPSFDRDVWRLRSLLRARVDFGQTPEARGLRWFDHSMFFPKRYASALSIAFAFVATHNHFVLDRGGKVFKQSAPVIKLPEGATEDDHYDLLGVLNSSLACFWLKQVSHDKGNGGYGGGIADQEWERFYEFTSTKLAEFPLPGSRARVLAKRADEVARARAGASPAAALASVGIGALESSRREWERLGRELVWLQEELDWRMYVAYGLADAELAPEEIEFGELCPEERAFELAMGRDDSLPPEALVWFSRHGRSLRSSTPSSWPEEYRNLVERRIEAATSDKSLKLLEQPQFKRRWGGVTWEDALKVAVRDALLETLERPDLWRDGSGRPLARTTAQLADELRKDNEFRKLLTVHVGSQDYDLPGQLQRLLAADAVPAFAPLRYKPSGLEKFRAWEHTWDLQRAEDRGERVTIPVPPKYTQADFLKPTYWTARGKLDVPKERFIALPGTQLPDDPTPLYGWAGWDHAERGVALARLANQVVNAPEEQLIPVLGALVELQPWLDQWHSELDGRGATSPAASIAAATERMIARLGTNKEAIVNWRPATLARGRRKAS